MINAAVENVGCPSLGRTASGWDRALGPRAQSALALAAVLGLLELDLWLLRGWGNAACRIAVYSVLGALVWSFHRHRKAARHIPDAPISRRRRTRAELECCVATLLMAAALV